MPTPRQWGPAIWFTLHTLAAAYPEKPTDSDRESFVNLMQSLSLRLPCGMCATHLQEELKEFPIYDHTESKVKLEKYIYDLHNRVNTKTGKPIVHTFEEVQEAFVNGKWWNGFGGYPIPKDPALEEIKQKQTEIKSHKSIRTRNIVFLLILLVVMLGIPIVILAPYLSKCKNKKE